MTTMTKTQKTAFHFDNSYARELPGFYANCQPEKVAQPMLSYWNDNLASELGINLTDVDKETRAAWFSGQTLPDGAEPIAQVYAGHQFGQFNPQLGDGRAHLLGEILNSQQQRRDISLKGSGRTPFSRGGDGKAAIGPMLREVLIGEALHALGIPSTRSLAVVTTGEEVYREEPLPGAILTRVASSHIRIGTFEFFAANSDIDKLTQLADYTIARHDPELITADSRYLAFFDAVLQRQAALIAQWMGVGFIHGVMNTDNMTISGESIDYGPCAFMENYQAAAVFSSIDQFSRYAYQNQPGIAHWNLSRLAQALLPLFHQDQEHALALAQETLDRFSTYYQQHWLTRMLSKLGLIPTETPQDDKPLIDDWLTLLEKQRVDFTLAWRYLADMVAGNDIPLRDLFNDQKALNHWLQQWQARREKEKPVTNNARADAMRSINPWLIPRNHQVEAALAAASNDGELQPFNTLLSALAQPYTENPDYTEFTQPAPTHYTQSYKTFCGT